MDSEAEAEEPEANGDVAEELSHVARASHPGGGLEARMVDVSGKAPSRRAAAASATVRFPAGMLASVLAQGGPKGPIQEVARVAGILAAKRTGDLIPMCHPLGLDHVEIQFAARGDLLTVSCRTSTFGRTGVEMEAMTGATVAALTVYDITKALSKGIRIEAVALLEKSGGKSGTWRSPDAQGPD